VHDFASADAFGPAAPGTLAGWDPTGRWFLTGIAVAGEVSSVMLKPLGGGAITVDGAATPGTMDETQVFWSGAVQNGSEVLVATRISNLLSDGTLRAQHASCDGTTCSVCTAIAVRATHFNNEGEGDHISLVGELRGTDWGPGYTFNVRMMGTLAYLIRQDGLHIIETADPAHPTELGHYRRSGNGYSNDIKLVQTATRRYAVIADFPIDVVDVTDPAHPLLAGNIAEEAHTLAVEQRDGKVYAYLGNYDGNCPIYDVTDPTAAVKLGTFASGGQLVHDLSVDNGIAYLNAWDAGFLVVDYTTPATPKLLGTWGPTPTKTSHSN
jgi:hypothetical protein